ncbi:MAG: HD domain-containing phosphohydrolase [Rubrivivax sp.]|nr:HD domain-containing phosphohydrolase [Rubrivivax sp.]
MPFAELSSVKHRLVPGAPLPFNVRDADRTLLLARGQMVESNEQLEAIMRRGALVDMAELQSPRDQILQAPRELLPQIWQQAMAQLGLALADATAPSFREALVEAAAPVQTLVERDPDLAIFQVLRQGASADLAYGAQRSLQTAITSLLVAQRLSWEPAEAERAFKVALTMNLSMLELQGQLARQATPPTPDQRLALQTHPMRSVRLLETAGISDPLWLRAVLQHHECEDGSGYPSGSGDVCDLASLVRRSDVYTSKLASRSTRDAMSADIAGRQMFMQDPGHPMTAALVKEFGIYPPGCHVRLASGELAVVVARGAAITAPVVACLSNARGAPLSAPVRRDTSDRKYAVAGVVGEASVYPRLPLDRLMAALVA